jgi:hypothetical protein
MIPQNFSDKTNRIQMLPINVKKRVTDRNIPLINLVTKLQQKLFQRFLISLNHRSIYEEPQFLSLVGDRNSSSYWNRIYDGHQASPNSQGNSKIFKVCVFKYAILNDGMEYQNVGYQDVHGI